MNAIHNSLVSVACLCVLFAAHAQQPSGKLPKRITGRITSVDIKEQSVLLDTPDGKLKSYLAPGAGILEVGDKEKTILFKGPEATLQLKARNSFLSSRGEILGPAEILVSPGITFEYKIKDGKGFLDDVRKQDVGPIFGPKPPPATNPPSRK